jgi:CIC family chloride channel protein
MGWKGNTFTPGRIFGTVVDTIIRQATCDVILVKLGNDLEYIRFNRWLVPMAGGPNAPIAIKLLPSLVTLGNDHGNDTEICFTQVFKPSKFKPDTKFLETAMNQLMRNLNLESKVITAPIEANSVPDGVINLVKKKHYDVVILGASREGLLQQAIQGNIPETIAANVDSTVILVRGEIS